MRTLVTTVALLAFSSFPVMAADDMRSLDRDGDRFASFGEMLEAYPQFSRYAFRELDSNRDNRLSSTELKRGPARSLLARQDTFGHRASDPVDTDGGTTVHFTRSGGRLLWPGSPTHRLDELSHR